MVGAEILLEESASRHTDSGRSSRERERDTGPGRPLLPPMSECNMLLCYTLCSETYIMYKT